VVLCPFYDTVFFCGRAYFDSNGPFPPVWLLQYYCSYGVALGAPFFRIFSPPFGLFGNQMSTPHTMDVVVVVTNGWTIQDDVMDYRRGDDVTCRYPTDRQLGIFCIISTPDEVISLDLPCGEVPPPLSFSCCGGFSS
jgi:hypothetical protein